MTITNRIKHFIRVRFRRRIHHLVRWWCNRHGLAIVDLERLEAIKSENRRLRHTDGPYPDLSNYGKDSPEVTP